MVNVVGMCISCGCTFSFENQSISIKKPYILDKKTGYYFCSEDCMKEFHRVLKLNQEGVEIGEWGIKCPLKEKVI